MPFEAPIIPPSLDPHLILAVEKPTPLVQRPFATGKVVHAPKETRQSGTAVRKRPLQASGEDTNSLSKRYRETMQHHSVDQPPIDIEDSSRSEAKLALTLSWEPCNSDGAPFALADLLQPHPHEVLGDMVSKYCLPCTLLRCDFHPSHGETCPFYSYGLHFTLFCKAYRDHLIPSTRNTRLLVTSCAFSFCGQCCIEKCICPSEPHLAFVHHDDHCPGNPWFLQVVYLAMRCGSMRQKIAKSVDEDVTLSPSLVDDDTVQLWARWAATPWGTGLSRGSIFAAIWLRMYSSSQPPA